MASDSSTRTPNPIGAFLGITAAFVVIPAVLVWALAVKKPVNEIEQRRAVQRTETRAKLDAEAQAKLDSEGWVDKAKGIAHVPIAQAMTMVVAELSAKKPAPSAVKVEAPLPMPVADPATGEPPPPALPSAPQGADTIRFAVPAAALTPAVPVPAPAVPDPAPPTTEKPAESAPAPVPPALPRTPASPPAPAIPPAPEPAPAAPAPHPVPNPTENPAPAQ